jgi:hypothetical protein
LDVRDLGGVHTLNLWGCLNLRKFPKNLKTIKCNKNYKYINDFKDYEVIYN